MIYDDELKNDLKVIETLVKNNAKVKIIDNLNNIGAGASRNTGINLQTFLVFVLGLQISIFRNISKNILK